MVIGFIAAHPGLERSGLNRTIEGIGIVGSNDAITIVQTYARKLRADEHAIDFCYLAIEHIKQKNGELVELTEEDVFGGGSE